MIPILSGNEITDAVRRDNAQGDGLLPEQGSTGIWEATTNLATNGGFETDTSGWGSGANLTLTRVTSDHFFGKACARVATLAVAGSRYINLNPAPTIDQSQAVTMSYWAKADPTSERPAPRLNVSFNNELTPAAIPITGEWARYTVTAPGGSMTTSTPQIYITDDTDGSEVNVYYLDGIQFEQQPLATPYVEANGATATRAAAIVRGSAVSLDETQGWIAARVSTPSVENLGGSAFEILFDWRDDGNNDLVAFYYEATNALYIKRRNGSGTQEGEGGSWQIGGISTVVFAWTATQLKGSINGAAFTVVAGSAFIPTLSSAIFDIGQIAGGNGLDGTFFWFAAGSGTLTDADANLISRFNNDPKMADFPGTPTWFWDSGPDGTQVPLVMGRLGTGRV